jgi:para-nitrobenzyl esterase
MVLLGAGVLRLAAFAVFGTLAFAASPSVTVPGLGELKGKYTSLTSDVAVFLGIPFAKAPVGNLRWMPPQPYGAWEGQRDATSYGKSCVGAVGDHQDVGGQDESEDCLFLNVALHTKELSAKRSVLVWLYGGTYDTGKANSFTPELMVGAASQPVVVVTLNYRINTFGFLGSRALAARSPDGSTGNYGLQDQRLALRWVRNHISAFGGKGDDVTIFGESAGGNSVLHHLVQPASFGLYQKAIIESGTYDAGYYLPDAEALYGEIIKKAGCGDDLNCFLNKSSTKVEVAKNAAASTSKLANLHWGPIVDGVSMTGTPQELIAAGKFNNKVPVLIGTNRDEWAAFATGADFVSSYPPQMSEAQFDRLLAYLGHSNIKTVKRLYDPSVYAYPTSLGKYSQWWWMAMRVGTDNGIPFKGFPKGASLGHCSARRVAERFVRGGTPGLYMYNFARPLSGGMVGHGIEIPFVFNMGLLLGISPGNHDLSSAMITYWARFATTGTPSTPDAASSSLPHWPKYEPDGDKASIRFDATFSAANITLQHEFRRAACDFWDSIAATNVSATNVLVV